MAIGNVTSASANVAQQALRTQSERAEVGADRDGDADDRKAGANSSPKAAVPAATVNVQGQEIGRVVSVKA